MEDSLPRFELDSLAPEQVFVLEHVFAAPAAQLFEAFTSVDQLVQWFGPEGWTVPRETAVVEPCVGGSWTFTMVNRENPELTSPSEAVFVNLIPGKLIEGVQTLPEDSGSSSFFMRVEFISRRDGETLLRIAQGPLPQDIHEQAAEGWLSSYRKLERLLAN